MNALEKRKMYIQEEKKNLEHIYMHIEDCYNLEDVELELQAHRRLMKMNVYTSPIQAKYTEEALLLIIKDLKSKKEIPSITIRLTENQSMALYKDDEIKVKRSGAIYYITRGWDTGVIVKTWLGDCKELIKVVSTLDGDLFNKEMTK